MEKPKTLKELMEIFAKANAKRKEELQKMITAYGEAVGHYGEEAKEAFREQYPQVASVAWNRMLRCHHGGLYIDLVFAGSPACVQLSMCPIEDQKKYLGDTKFQVHTQSGNHVLVALHNLQPIQVAQVFDNGAVRDLAGQRAWQEAQKQKGRLKAAIAECPSDKIEVKGQDLWVNGVRLTRAQLLTFLQQMESNGKKRKTA